MFFLLLNVCCFITISKTYQVLSGAGLLSPRHLYPSHSTGLTAYKIKAQVIYTHIIIFGTTFIV